MDGIDVLSALAFPHPPLSHHLSLPSTPSLLPSRSRGLAPRALPAAVRHPQEAGRLLLPPPAEALQPSPVALATAGQTPPPSCQGARVAPQAVRNLAPPLRLASLPAGWLESPSRAPSYLRV